MQRNRQAALDGLARILDANGLEELFAGSDDEVAFLCELLADASRGRSSSLHREIRRTARRRGVTPEYVADRAAVLRAAMDERRRGDLYRVLGVPPLATADVLRRRWIEFARANDPDAGGDVVRFRRVKDAWEVLRDPDRRARYERFWRGALGPFERAVLPGGTSPQDGARCAASAAAPDEPAQGPTTTRQVPALDDGHPGRR